MTESVMKSEFASVVTQLAAAANDLHALVVDIRTESANGHDEKVRLKSFSVNLP